jgi:hypothetical protein
MTTARLIWRARPGGQRTVHLDERDRALLELDRAAGGKEAGRKLAEVRLVPDDRNPARVAAETRDGLGDRAWRGPRRQQVQHLDTGRRRQARREDLRRLAGPEQRARPHEIETDAEGGEPGHRAREPGDAGGGQRPLAVVRVLRAPRGRDRVADEVELPGGRHHAPAADRARRSHPSRSVM